MSKQIFAHDGTTQFPDVKPEAERPSPQPVGRLAQFLALDLRQAIALTLRLCPAGDSASTRTLMPVEATSWLYEAVIAKLFFDKLPIRKHVDQLQRVNINAQRRYNRSELPLPLHEQDPGQQHSGEP